MFSFKFLPDAPCINEDEPNGWYGEIVIGDFSEKFVLPLSFWSKKEYETQWEQAILRIVNGESVSACITSLYNDPKFLNFFTWWPIYRRENSVIITEQMLLMENLEKPFSLNRPHEHITSFSPISEDGEPVSHWKTTVKALEVFLGRERGEG